MVDLSMQKSFEFEAPSPWKPWAIAIVAAIAILTVALGLMNALSLFKIPTDDTGAKTIAAALALIGSLVATVVTLMGTVVKYSIDDRNARLAASEAHRAHSLAIEAERRNRIDTAIRAVDLLGENNKDSSLHQIGGAILALVNLGEIELAISLLSELWPAGLTSSSIAQRVLISAFESSSESIAVLAGTVIRNNAEQIDQNGSHIWPIQSVGWNVDLPLNARTALACSAVTWMTVALSRQRELPPTALLVLYKALEDPEFSIRDIAAAALRPLTRASFSQGRLITEEGILSIVDIFKRLENFPEKPETGYGTEASQKVREVLAEPSLNLLNKANAADAKSRAAD